MASRPRRTVARAAARETTVPVPALPRVTPCWARTLAMPAMPISRPAAEVRGWFQMLARVLMVYSFWCLVR